MATERPHARGFTASGTASPGLRPLDYFLIGVCVVALIAVGVVGARGNSQAQQAASAQNEVKKLNGSLQALQTQIQQLSSELQSLKGLKSQLSTLETRIGEVGNVTPDQIRDQVRGIVEEENRNRQAQFRAELDKRGEEFVNRLANDKRVEQGLRDAVDKMRNQTKVEQAAPKTAEKPDAAVQQNVAEPKKEADPIQVGVAKGAETLAEGLKLWRDFQDGKITKEQFDAQRKGLEDNFRAAIEQNMTPQQREEIQKRMQEWRERRQGGGGGGAVKPPQPVDEKF
jgi:hypothetical protein